MLFFFSIIQLFCGKSCSYVCLGYTGLCRAYTRVVVDLNKKYDIKL